jgi:hypothetical protein
MNVSRKRKVFVILSCGVLFAFVSCQSVTTAIDTSNTDKLAIETIVQGKDLEATITDIKTITDKSKGTGEITKPDTVKIIEYVDKSKMQVAELNTKLFASETSRIDDNKKMGNTINEQASTISSLKYQRDAANKWMFISLIVNAVFILLTTIYIILKLKKLISI